MPWWVKLWGFFTATGGTGLVDSAIACIYGAEQRTATMLMQTHEARLKALRKEMQRQGLDGFVDLLRVRRNHLAGRYS